MIKDLGNPVGGRTEASYEVEEGSNKLGLRGRGTVWSEVNSGRSTCEG